MKLLGRWALFSEGRGWEIDTVGMVNCEWIGISEAFISGVVFLLTSFSTYFCSKRAFVGLTISMHDDVHTFRTKAYLLPVL